jgi:hypothetical protein
MCRSRAGVWKAAVDLGPEQAPRRGRRARANVAQARAPHGGRGMGCLPVPAACSWATPDMAVPTLCGLAASRVAAGNWPTDIVSSFLFSEYIQILANSKKIVGFV